MKNLGHIPEKTTLLTTYLGKTYLDTTILKKINEIIDAVNYQDRETRYSIEKIRQELQDLNEEFTEFVTEIKTKK